MDQLKEKEKMRVILLPTEKAENGCLLMGLAEYGWANQDVLYYLSGMIGDILHYSDAKSQMSAGIADMIPTVLSPRHIYVVSNREVKNGDWFIHPVLGLHQYQKSELGNTAFNALLEQEYYPVVASTDKSLGVHNISEGFILAYVKQFNLGTPIEEIMVDLVEKEECECYYTKFCQSTQLEEGYYCRDQDKPQKKFIKTDRDNTITITKVVDTWEDIWEQRENFKYFGQFWEYLTTNYSVPKKLK